MVPPNSFSACNQRLLNRQILVDLDEYIALTNAIPYNVLLLCSPNEVADLINFMISIMHYHPRDFVISIYSLEKFGFLIKNTFSNKIRSIRNIPINRLKNELAFLKKYKLKMNVDFYLYRNRIDDIDVDIEYRITTLGFYKLINIKYNRIFLTLLDSRIFQIISFYKQYMDEYYTDRIKSLERTVNGLTLDISKLVHSQSKVSLNDVSGGSNVECGCHRQSFISSGSSYKSHINIDANVEPYFGSRISFSNKFFVWSPPGSPPNSPKTPINIILEESNDMHEQVMNMISPHESSAHNMFDSRSSIPISMIGDGIHGNHIDVLRRRFSTFIQPNKETFDNGTFV